VGTGSKIRFWYDVLCGDHTLRVAFVKLFNIVHIKKLRSLSSFYFSNFFKSFPDLAASGDHVSSIPSPSSSFTLASLSPVKDIVAFSWIKLGVIFSSGGAYGRVPLEFGFWFVGGTRLASDGASVFGGS
jgi:hypothetical protein